MPDSTYNANLPTNMDRVRLLVSDIGGDTNEYLFKDSEIIGFLDMNGDNILRATSMALRVIASNAVQVSKRIRFLQLQTDGPAEAKALRELAEEFDAKASASATFEVATMDVDVFTHRYIIGMGDW